MMRGDGGIDQIAPQPAQSRQPILVGPGEPAVSGHIRRKNVCEFPRLRHGCPFTRGKTGKASDHPKLALLMKLTRPFGTWIKLALPVVLFDDHLVGIYE